MRGLSRGPAPLGDGPAPSPTRRPRGRRRTSGRVLSSPLRRHPRPAAGRDSLDPLLAPPLPPPPRSSPPPPRGKEKSLGPRRPCASGLDPAAPLTPPDPIHSDSHDPPPQPPPSLPRLHAPRPTPSFFSLPHQPPPPCPSSPYTRESPGFTGLPPSKDPRHPAHFVGAASTPQRSAYPAPLLPHTPPETALAHTP